MERMGIDYSKLIIPNPIPSTIEQVFTFIDKITALARTKIPDKSKVITIVWDSVAATNGEAEKETSYEDSPGLGLEARAMSRGFRKIISTLDEGYITLVCVNQLRQKIGTVSWGDQDITPHGRALAFYSSVRIKLKSMNQIKNSKKSETLGIETEAKVFKNKVGPNHRSVKFPLYYDWGINDEASLMDFLNEKEVIKGAQWKTLTLNGQEYKWQGYAPWIEMLDKPEIKKFALDTVNDLMIKSFDSRPEDMQIDLESALEVEQLKIDLKK